MRKLFYSAGVMIAMLVACETQDEISVIPVTTKPVSQVVGNPDSLNLLKPDSVVQAVTPVVTPYLPEDESVAATSSAGLENFNIIFSQTFSKNTLGNYKESEWKADWKYPAWANHKYGYGYIAQEGTNKHIKLNHYAGSFGAGNGYQWETKFGKVYNELYFSYRIKFSSGFAVENLDGKLPGMGGGKAVDAGKLPNGIDIWGGKYMFKGTKVKFYLYYMEMYKLCGDAAPVAGKTYWGQGPFLDPGYTFKPGVWYTITQRVVMNTVGKADGLVEGYVNGKLVCSLKGLRFRSVSTLGIDKISFGNFFGGSGVPPSKNEYILFDDFYAYTYSSSVNVARGNVSNPTGTTILLPNL